MNRYEYSEGSSNKYWEISVEGTSVVTHYGRIGTSGQKTLKELATAEAAKKEAERLTASKLKKGYVAVARKKATKKKAAKKAPGKKAPEKKTTRKKVAQKTTRQKVAKKAPAAEPVSKRAPRAVGSVEDLVTEAWELVGDAAAQRRLYSANCSLADGLELAWQRMQAIEKTTDDAQMESYRALSADPDTARVFAPYMTTLTCEGWPAFALSMVGDWGDARAVPTIRAGLDKANEYSRSAFILCLAKIDDDPAYLTKLARKKIDPDDRTAIDIALARRGDEERQQALVTSLETWIDARRKTILSGVTGARVHHIGLGPDDLVGAIGELKLAAAVPALVDALETTSAIPAAEALGAVGDTAAVAPLEAYLSRLSGSPKRNRGYRLAVENALSRLGRPQPLDTARTALEWAYPQRYGYPKIHEVIEMYAMAAEAILERGKRSEIEQRVLPLATSYYHLLRQVGARAYKKLHGKPFAPTWYDVVLVQQLVATESKKKLLARLDDPSGVFRANLASALFGNGTTPEAEKVAAWCRRELESTLNYPTSYDDDLPAGCDTCLELIRRLPAKRRASLIKDSPSRWIRKYLGGDKGADGDFRVPSPELPLCASVRRFDGVPFSFGKPVNALALSGSGALAVVGDKLGAVVDAETGSFRTPLKLRDRQGHDCCFAPDGEKLAVAYNGGVVALFDAESGEPLWTVQHHKGDTDVRSVAFSPDGKLLASAADDDQVVLMRAATGDKVRAHKGGGGSFTCVAFTPDGRRCIAAHVKAARAGKSYLLDVDARAGKAKKVELRQVVWSIAVRARGGLVALGTKGKEILLFDASYKELGKLKQAGVCRLAFSTDGDRLFAASESGEIARFVLPDRIVKSTLPEAERVGDGDAGLRGMAVDRDCGTVFVGGQFGSVDLWRADGTSLEAAGGGEAHSDQVKAVCLRPDGSVVTSGWDGKLLLWPAEGGGAELLYSHGSRLEEAFLTPDGKRVAVVGREQAFLVDVDRRKLLARWPQKGAKKIRSMALSPDGSVIALGVGVEVCFFSLPSFKPIGEPIRAAGDTIDALWCLDNRRAISGAEDGLVSLVDAKKGVVWTLGDHGRDLIEGEPHGDPHKDVAGIAVNRARTLLATAATDHSVRIYRLGKGDEPPQRVQRALLAFSLFSGLAFITDERLAATTDELDVIDAQSGELLLHLDRADFDGEEATRLAVRSRGPDGGAELLIGTENGSIYAVQIAPE